jgi:DNA modification methylase
MIEKVSIKNIKSNPNNPRVIRDDKFRKLVKSINEFPEMLELRPIVVNDDMVVLGGNMRLKACKEAGLDEVAIIKASNLSEAQQAEFIIKDNVGFGEWDWDMLANEYNDQDLKDWGLDLPVFESVNELEAEEDYFETPEGGIETDIVLGDLFEIGEHRLLCGDSTDSDAVAKLMNGEKADMVFTDPPYNISSGDNQTGIIGENLKKQKQSISFISEFNPIEFLNTLPTVFEKTMNAYIFCNKDLLPNYLVWAKDAGYSFNVLIWKKPNAIPIKDAHRPDIEYLLLFRKSAIWNYGIKDVNYSRCLEYGRESGLHPTMKPIELIANEMKISSNVSSIVFDFFLGSGSTMVASHQLKRRCYGMELDPKYCQVIIDRMLKLDPSLKVLRNGKPYEKAH